MPSFSEEDLKKRLAKDPDGLMTYEFMANHISEIDDILPTLVDNMIAVDRAGRFSVSAARYLAAIDRQKFEPQIARLVDHAIESDREHQFIADLLPALWGADYADRAAELMVADRSFRRIHQRIFPPKAL